MKTNANYTEGITWSGNVRPDYKTRFYIKWKKFELEGSIPFDVRELTEDDIEFIESSIREEIQQMIIEHCLDLCLDEEARMNKEYALEKGLLKTGEIKYYEIETGKQINRRRWRVGDYGYCYSDFTVRDRSFYY